MNVNLIFDSSKESIELIKLSTFYYDKVNILCPPIFLENQQELQFHNKSILDSVNILVENGTASIEHISEELIPETIEDNFWDLILDYFNPKTRQQIDAGMPIYYIHPKDFVEAMETIDEQLIHTYFSLKHQGFDLTFLDGDDTADMPPNIEYAEILMVIYIQFFLSYNSICRKQNVISSNNITSDFLAKFLQNSKGQIPNVRKNTEQLIAPNALSILLPNLHEMSFEDILNLRHLAKDELMEMRYYIGNLAEQYSPDDTKLENPKQFLERKINPAIKQLESKVCGMKINTLQKALQSLQNPFAYTPMLTTFFSNIPAHIALAASMGIVSVNAGLEYLKQKNELATDPLFFSVKLKKKINDQLDKP